LDANLGEDQPKYPVLTVSKNLQRRSIPRVAVRLHDDLHILIKRHEEAQKALNGKLPELAAQHLPYIGLANSEQTVPPHAVAA
jgi:hypothetical protein